MKNDLAYGHFSFELIGRYRWIFDLTDQRKQKMIGMPIHST